MKKTISIVLAAMMILCMIPFGASAGTTKSLNDKVGSNVLSSNLDLTVSEANDWYISSDFIINGGAVLTVGAGVTLTINANVSLTLNNCVINNFGTIVNKGTIYNSSNIACLSGGQLYHDITIEAPHSTEYAVYVNSTGSYDFTDDTFDTVDGYGATHTGFSDHSSSTSYKMLDGTTLYMSVVFSDPSVDPYKFSVVGTSKRDRGVYELTATNATTITFGAYRAKDLIKTFDIVMPSGDGYCVCAYGVEFDDNLLEIPEEKHTVKYGEDFSFRVEIYPGWQESEITVTVNGKEVEADSYGYYTIKNITALPEINVSGVVSDDVKDMLNGIMDFVKQIFATIKEIFSAFMELFNFGSTADAE